MVGIGVDLVDIRRFRLVVDRSPGIVTRVFTDQEMEQCGGPRLRVASLAARWAAKEAVAKVLVDNRGLAWHDCEVLTGAHGQPSLQMRGSVEAAAAGLGIASWQISLSHDGHMAIAFVLASGGPK